jgi:hypothetical protein
MNDWELLRMIGIVSWQKHLKVQALRKMPQVVDCFVVTQNKSYKNPEASTSKQITKSS